MFFLGREGVGQVVQTSYIVNISSNTEWRGCYLDLNCHPPHRLRSTYGQNELSS